MNDPEKALEYLSEAIKEVDAISLVIEQIMDKDGYVDKNTLEKAKRVILVEGKPNTSMWELNNEFGQSGIPIVEDVPDLVAESVSEICEILYDIVDLFNNGTRFYNKGHEDNYIFGLNELTKSVQKFERNYVGIGNRICSANSINSMFYSYLSIQSMIYGQVEALFLNSNPTLRKNNSSIYDISEQDEIDGGYRDGKWTW